MRRILYLVLANAVMLLMVYSFSASLSSCTKEGPTGANGQNGTDANSWCVMCHTTANMDAVQAEYVTSKHGIAATVAEGNRNTCAACHSNEGFNEVWRTGWDTTAVNNAIATPIGCPTCHGGVHLNFDTTQGFDYALQFTDPFRERFDSSTISNLHGTSYLCAKCHQARLPSPFPTSLLLTDSLKPSSYRYGTHYGVMANMLSGQGPFKFPGSLPYDNDQHTSVAQCADCHMAKANGTQSGGHTWRMKNDDGSEHLDGCKKCHPSATSFDINGKQTEIAALIKQLGDKLHAITVNGVTLLEVDNTGAYTGQIWPSTTTAVMIPNKYAAAMLNFQFAMRDKSNGVHNYKFTKALLQNTIDAI
ncbi:MAG: hypothetical protein NTW49_10835 [Bacteroidia bacterium]|nr:hypothetical protein [Bacteroidia bacterium]